MWRWSAIALLLFSLACVQTTTLSRIESGPFAPKDDPSEEDAVPRGISLSINSVAPDGTIILDLRNYSLEPFVFAGGPEHPRLIIEAQSGSTRSRHTVSRWTRTKTHELPAGERMQLKVDVGGVVGRARIGIRSHDFGYIVWTNWIPL